MNMGALLKQAKNMQKKMEGIQSNFNNQEFEYSDGAGNLKVKIKGDLSISDIYLAPELLEKDNQETLQDLLMLTLNKAIAEVEAKKKEALEDVTGGLDLGGLM